MVPYSAPSQSKCSFVRYAPFYIIKYSRVVQTVGPGPKFGPLTDFFLGPLGLKYMH